MRVGYIFYYEASQIQKHKLNDREALVNSLRFANTNILALIQKR